MGDLSGGADGRGPRDEHFNEPYVFLATLGELTEAEISNMAEDADEARPRIGTDAEHIGSDGGVDRIDRRAVKLHEAVTEALE